MSPADRKVKAKDSNHCFNCLKFGHNSYECTAPGRCSICNRKHHTLLHDDIIPQVGQFGSNRLNASANAFSPSGTGSNQQVAHQQVRPSTSGIVQAWTEQWQVSGIAVVTSGNRESEEPILNAKYNGADVQILLDTGSRRTLIKRSHVRHNLFHGQPMVFDGVGGLNSSREMALFQVVSKQGKIFEFIAYVLERLPGDLDMLIGSDQLYKVMKPESLSADKRCYFDTEFGQLKFGGTNKEEKIGRASCRERV